MNDPVVDRAEAFLSDILGAADELAAVLAAQRAAIRDLPMGGMARPTWRFVGMGSSRFAALDAAARLRAAGRDAHAELASASGGTPGGRDVLMVAISSSGRTPEVVRAVARHLGASFVLGLTARPDSPLAEAADAVVPLAAARTETAGVASLTYRATLAALLVLAGEVGPAPDGIPAAVPALAALLEGRSAWLSRAADLLDTGREIHVLGDGARQGTLEQAALVFREGPRIAALPCDTGDWLHTGLYTLFPGDPVLLLGGSPADDEAVATIRARGGVVVSAGPARSDTDLHVQLPDAALANEAVRLLVEPAVAELLAAELWRRTDARTLREGPAR